MLSIERLEARDLPAVSLAAGVLTVTGDEAGNRIEVSRTADQVQVSIDGCTAAFDARGVNRIVVDGGRGDDYLVNRTALDAVLSGGPGNDYLQGGGGSDRLFGGAGADILSDFVPGTGANLLDGGDGHDNLWGGFGAADTLLGGAGNDVLYDIVGGPNTVDGGPGRDKIITRATDTLFADPADTQVALFGAAGPGVTLLGGTLYLIGDGTDNRISVRESGKRLLVTLSDANGPQAQTFDRRDVKFIAGLGGDGDDLFINNTTIDSVFYGTGGDDVLVGGAGNDILKGGSGGDTLLGNAGRDDLTGDAGADVILGGRGRDVVRFDGLDFFVEQDDHDRRIQA